MSFWSQVHINEDNPDTCWIWLGPCFVGDGYGRYATKTKIGGARECRKCDAIRRRIERSN